MGKERKKTAEWVWPLRGLLLTLGLYTGLVALVALLTVRGTVGEEAALPAMGGACAAAAFTGGLLSARKGSWPPMSGALAVAGGLALCMVAVGLTWEEGIGTGAVVLLTCCAAGGLLAGLVGRRPGRRVRGRTQRRKL